MTTQEFNAEIVAQLRKLADEIGSGKVHPYHFEVQLTWRDTERILVDIVRPAMRAAKDYHSRPGQFKPEEIDEEVARLDEFKHNAAIRELMERVAPEGVRLMDKYNAWGGGVPGSGSFDEAYPRGAQAPAASAEVDEVASLLAAREAKEVGMVTGAEYAAIYERIRAELQSPPAEVDNPAPDPMEAVRKLCK